MSAVLQYKIHLLRRVCKRILEQRPSEARS